MSQSQSGFTKQMARNMFYGGTVFFILVFVGLILDTERKIPQRSNAQEITPLLEQEMIMHYYLQKGLNTWSTRKDPSILAAVDLLGKPAKFASILSRKEKP